MSEGMMDVTECSELMGACGGGVPFALLHGGVAALKTLRHLGSDGDL